MKGPSINRKVRREVAVGPRIGSKACDHLTTWSKRDVAADVTTQHAWRGKHDALACLEGHERWGFAVVDISQSTSPCYLAWKHRAL